MLDDVFNFRQLFTTPFDERRPSRLLLHRRYPLDAGTWRALFQVASLHALSAPTLLVAETIEHAPTSIEASIIVRFSIDEFDEYVDSFMPASGHVIAPPDLRWGVVASPSDFAVAAGPVGFAEELREALTAEGGLLPQAGSEFPEWDEVRAFADDIPNLRESILAASVPDWPVRLLRHIYGERAEQEIQRVARAWGRQT